MFVLDMLLMGGWQPNVLLEGFTFRWCLDKYGDRPYYRIRVATVQDMIECGCPVINSKIVGVLDVQAARDDGCEIPDSIGTADYFAIDIRSAGGTTVVFTDHTGCKVFVDTNHFTIMGEV